MSLPLTTSLNISRAALEQSGIPEDAINPLMNASELSKLIEKRISGVDYLNDDIALLHNSPKFSPHVWIPFERCQHKSIHLKQIILIVFQISACLLQLAEVGPPLKERFVFQSGKLLHILPKFFCWASRNSQAVLVFLLEIKIGTMQQLLRFNSLSFQSIRWNCPWHRNSFRPCYFPYKMQEKLNVDTVEKRTETRGGRLMLMRRILREQKFLGYVTKPTDSTKISYPL
ncbi:hypothetical protein GCK72_001149 [Caenorhabditis remanei]|uniref:Uncharacterized protein n=2 Tax=Caenorhabditis remanei TaxID=31234 RepID=A0A6A5HU72_CAERE|nr:hypothetical protein GCK72_001149 [Caenorhabditis remanei]KAF1769332.1 hypothetical protein GCK72_001149 [Caenorhabditis remanei]